MARQIKFEFNNKQWLVLDFPKEAKEVYISSKPDRVSPYFHLEYKINSTSRGGFALFYVDFGGKKKYPKDLQLFGKIEHITEEQAREIVEERQLDLWQKTQGFYKYYDYSSRNEFGISFLESAIESLHSLLKSKGVDNTWINLLIFNVI